MINDAFTVKKYGPWWFVVINNKTKLYVRDQNNNLVIFKTMAEAKDWIKLQNN